MWITYDGYNCFLEHANFKDDLIEYRCLCRNKSYQQMFDAKLKERFFYIYTYTYIYIYKFLQQVYFIAAKRCLSL